MTASVRRIRRRAARVLAAVRAWASDYWPGRRTVKWTLGMVVLFLMAGASLAQADDGSERGGILAPLNVLSSEGVPLDNYDLKSENGGTTDIRSHICNLGIGSAFALNRLIVGLMCMALKWIYEFPITHALITTADRVGWYFSLWADFDLKLSMLFVTGAFALGVWWIMRGKVAKGAGEILLTVLIGGLMFLPTLSTRAILGDDGPLAQVSAAATEAGQMTSSVGGNNEGCTSADDQKDPSCPMRVMLTKTLVVQPYQLLQYGIIPDPHSDNANIRALADVHNRWIHGQIKERKDCGGISWLPGGDGDLCKQSAWDKLKEELKKHGDEGNAAYNFAVNSNWDRTFGAMLVLLTSLLIAAVILSMCFVHLGTQFADVGAATMTPVAMIWAQLPGPNRAAVWKVLGTFMASAAVSFAISVMLPAFGIAVNAVMTDQKNTVMLQRMLLMVALAVILLVFHRRLLAGASKIGDRFAERMKYARIGGSAGLGEDSSRLGLAMSQAMAGMGFSPGGGGGGGGAMGGGIGGLGALGAQSPVHAAMLRRARINSGLASMASPDLGPMNAAGMVAGAFGEVRRGMHQLATPLRMAHHAVVGNPLPEHKLAKRRKPVNDGSGRMVIDGQTGEILHDPMKPTPWGHRLHNKLLETRAGRLAIRAGQVGRLGYDISPLGWGATVARMRRGAGTAAEAVHQQYDHYSGEFAQHMADQRAGWEAMDRPLKAVSDGAGWAMEHGKTAATNAASAATIYATTRVPADPSGVLGTTVAGTPRASEARASGDLFADPGDAGDWGMPASTMGREAGAMGDISAALGPGAFPDAPVADTELAAPEVPSEVPAGPADPGAVASSWRDAVPFAGEHDLAAQALRQRMEQARHLEPMLWDGMVEPGDGDGFGPGDLL
ncbi:hypothetical protein ACFWXO_13615 [Kitasatospora sp. NPDC059088]|uniref:hypothetical protein n=1 Tax=Kitasatospora sp. NPDC059088 TaxID=3346722 RepID=UPI00369D154E